MDDWIFSNTLAVPAPTTPIRTFGVPAALNQIAFTKSANRMHQHNRPIELNQKFNNTSQGSAV